MAIDLSKMDRKDLQKLIADAEKAIKQLKKKELKDAKKAAESAAAQFGFTLAELTGGAGKAVKKQVTAIKYVNPDDSDQTWTGRGRQPKWFKDAIASGKDASELEI
jgi:DNA-binding protein H-NS